MLDPKPPLTREEICKSLDELFDLFNEWDSLIQCEEDAEGFPVGNSLEANTKRLIADATSRTSRLIFQLLIRVAPAMMPRDATNG